MLGTKENGPNLDTALTPAGSARLIPNVDPTRVSHMTVNGISNPRMVMLATIRMAVIVAAAVIFDDDRPAIATPVTMAGFVSNLINVVVSGIGMTTVHVLNKAVTTR
ncbi:MAG: hypothetical protein AAGA53_10830 [Pseudomonadota bacterium]